jgi:4-hydroxymandelate synthase
MDVRSLDHIEFYVADAEKEAARLCESFGFTLHGRGGPETGLADCRSVLLRQGEIALLVTSALADSHRAAEYVRRHGDGVAVIAFAVEDAHAAFAEAIERGGLPLAPPQDLGLDDARVTFASVNGFGDVEHRFVSRARPEGAFAPGVIDEATPSPGGDGLLMAVDHIAVCVPAGELEQAVRSYAEVFSFTQTFEEKITVGAQAMNSKVVQSNSGKVTFTIIEPDVTRAPGQIDEFVRSHDGAGVQHLAFLTADIEAAVRTCQDRGVSFLDTPASYYEDLPGRLGPVGVGVATLRELNVLADRDYAGVMLQIFTRSRHERRTLFYELIDRRGARTFGSNNIKALYEAVERQRAADPA